MTTTTGKTAKMIQIGDLLGTHATDGHGEERTVPAHWNYPRPVDAFIRVVAKSNRYQNPHGWWVCDIRLANGATITLPLSATKYTVRY